MRFSVFRNCFLVYRRDALMLFVEAVEARAHAAGKPARQFETIFRSPTVRGVMQGFRITPAHGEAAGTAARAGIAQACTSRQLCAAAIGAACIKHETCH
nr:hypothetical protein [Burkholderia gladioli]